MAAHLVEEMNRNTEKEILKAIRSGDNHLALEYLYKDILPRVKKMILRNNGSEEEARDIFQDTVLVFYQQVKLNKFDETKEVGGFMYAVARNLWISRVKKANRRVAFYDTEALADACPDALDDLINDEKAQAINSVMDRIGEECKRLLKYTLHDRLSLREVAVKMGYSSNEVAKTYNYRCKQKLVNLVKDNPYLRSLFKE